MSKENCNRKSNNSSNKKSKKKCCCCKNNNYNNMMAAYSAYNAGFNAGAHYANFGSCGLGLGLGCNGCGGYSGYSGYGGSASGSDPIFFGPGFGLGFGAFNPFLPLLFL